MRLLALATLVLGSAPAAQDVSIPHVKVELENGLDVIVHEDRSDPVVAVYVYYHVGSGREVPGRSGFAHLFEHLMFQGSAHVGDDQHFKLVQEAGGTLNGSTNTDRTNYFETLPSNRLELALWLEADRMGFLLPAITQENLDNQREVVKNERRQNYENRPYGGVSEVVARHLYPPDHPYHWLTIGSMEDLDAAALEDVTAFFRRWYGPNNATIAIGGDVDTQEAIALVERWFGSIPRGPEVERPAPRPVALAATERVTIEDDVQLPQLVLTWPTVALAHADEAALDLLAEVLAGSKSAVLERALSIDEPVASSVSARHPTAELAGSFAITVRPRPGVSLDELEQRVRDLLAGVARDGVPEETLARLKTAHEAGVVRGLETVSARTSRLANDNVLRGEPDLVARDLARYRAVAPADVVRVLERYVIDRPAVIVSVVPAGRLELAASGRSADQRAREDALDRNAQPAPGPKPAFRVPDVWRATLANGVEVVGTAYDELPLSTLTLYLPAGRLHEDPAKLGLASLCADLLDEGTRRLDAPALADAFDALGATFSVRSDDHEIALALSALDDRFEPAVALLREVLLEPRFAEPDFQRIRDERLVALDARADDVRAIAGDAWDALCYGPASPLGRPALGTRETVERIALADVRAFFAAHATPAGSRLVYVGPRDARAIAEVLQPLERGWTAPEGAARAVAASAPAAAAPAAAAPGERKIYLIDKPGAAQSEIRVGAMSISELDPDRDALELLNHVLGGGFSSRINLNLREDKGYTYGARSGLAGDLLPGPLTVSAGVHTEVTAPAVAEVMKELEAIRTGPTDEELAFAQSSQLSAMDRSFESTRSLASYLNELTRYDRPDDFLLRRRAAIETATTAALAALAREHVDPDRMTILVVGDKERILADLAELPFGEVVEIDPTGAPISAR